MHPEIVDIVRMVAEMGLKPVINTNGGKLTMELLRELKKAGAAGFTFHIDSKQGRPKWKDKNELDFNELRLSYAEMLAEVGGLSCAFNSTVYAGEAANAEFAKLRALVTAAGRDPKSVGLGVWVSAAGDEASWRKELQLWKQAGVTHVTLNNVYARYHHQRIEGRTLADHIAAMKRYRSVVADLLS